VLDRVAAVAPAADVVVVSHGAVMMALWRHVTGEWRRGGVARNAGIVVVEHEAGRWAGATAGRPGLNLPACAWEGATALARLHRAA
jgi:broad specificity phosphatase PhoE